jgi:hypothetical protein
MVHRKGLVRAAACAALACAGIVRAETGGAGSDDVLRPLYLQAAAAPAAPASAPASAPAATPTPLMGFLETTPIGPKFDSIGLTVSGYFEGGYTASLNHPPYNTITGRVFDTKNEHIVLDQADIAFDRPVDATKGKFDIGCHFEAIYGFDSGLIHSDGLYDTPSQHYASSGSYYHSRTSPDNQFDIAEAYVDIAIPVGSGLRIRVGKIYTYLGYEVISPTGNQFYSHSYMFGYAIPFTNTGVWGEYILNPDVKIDAGGSIGEGQSLDDNNSTPDFVGELTYTPQESDFLKQWTIIANAEVGPEAAHDNHDYWTVIDLNAKWQFMGDGKVPGSMSVAVDADYGDAPHGLGIKSAQWGGVALYTNYVNTPNISFNTRVEWYEDAQGFTLGQPAGLNVYEATAGFTIQPLNDTIGSNLKIRPEARIDYSDKDYLNSGARHFQSSFGIDAYFAY